MPFRLALFALTIAAVLVAAAPAAATRGGPLRVNERRCPGSSSAKAFAASSSTCSEIRRAGCTPIRSCARPPVWAR